jgi:LuxR family maltose regulon positive regulatory protein
MSIPRELQIEQEYQGEQISSKITPPRLRANRVIRERLIDRFNSHSLEDLALVVSPAGCGKSTLLAEWAMRSSGTPAWITLDEQDNDPVRFWCNVGASLRAGGAPISDRSAASLTTIRELPIEFALGPMISDLTKASSPVLILFDDFQCISDEHVFASVLFLIDHLPATTQIVFGSRAELPFPTSRLRAHGRILEIRTSQLAFTEEEASELIRLRNSMSWPPDKIQSLVDLTEGCVMGLRGASISLEKGIQPESILATMESYGNETMDFFRKEIFNFQSEEVQDFLVRTAFLPQLSGDLCDYVLGKTNSAEILDSLDRTDLYVSAFDDATSTYRVHPSVLQSLRRDFETRPSNERESLSRKAAEWFASRGQREEAIDYALGGKDWSLAVEQMAQLSALMLPIHRPVSLKRWLAEVPHEHLIKAPSVCVQLARTLMYSDLRSNYEPLLQAAETHAILTEDIVMRASVLNVRMYGECFRGSTGNTISITDAIFALLSPDETRQRGITQHGLAVAYLLSDRIIEAETTAIQSYRNSLSAGNGLTACFALDVLSLANTHRGRLNDAIHYLDMAHGLALSGQFEGILSLPFHRAKIRLDRLLLSEAEGDIDETESRCEHTGYRIFIAGVHLLRARLRWVQGRIEEAFQSLSIYQSVRQSIGSSENTFSEHALSLKMSVDLGDRRAVEEWLIRDSRDEDLEERLGRHRALAWLAIKDRDESRALEEVSVLRELAGECGEAGQGVHMVRCQLAIAATFERVGRHLDAMTQLVAAIEFSSASSLLSPFWEERHALLPLYEEARAKGIQQVFMDELLFRLGTSEPEAKSSSAESRLSTKEMEVLQLLANGLSNVSIARQTQLSENTIKTHLQHIYSKLNAKNRTQAVSTARSLHIIP